MSRRLMRIGSGGQKLILPVIIAFVLAATSFGKDPYILVLGTAQDAGAPQMGCMSEYCQSVWNGKVKRTMVSSLAIVDPKSGRRWIFDATPDLPEQFQLLKKTTGDFSNRIDGIFLTHAHIGHYTGLMYLGKESFNAENVLVYALPRMSAMLAKNAPWSQLVSLGNIRLAEISTSESVKLSEDISVESFTVPHRDEFSETAGFRIVVGKKSAVFIPDIDKWSKWDKSLEDVARANDLLFIDGTFFRDGEIPRPISEVPHPFVTETMEILKDLPRSLRKRVRFIHMNHSNPLLQMQKSALAEMTRSGFGVAREGEKYEF